MNFLKKFLFPEEFQNDNFLPQIMNQEHKKGLESFTKKKKQTEPRNRAKTIFIPTDIKKRSKYYIYIIFSFFCP